MGIPDTTPVIIGVGEASERVSDPGFARLSPVELASAAARAALNDAGAPHAVASIDVVAAIRQFEISTPRAVALFGASNNFPRSVARRIGADPGLAILEASGGQGPQHLVNELGGRIAGGEISVALICGSEAISTVRHASARDERLEWSETVAGSLDDRGYGIDGLLTDDLIRHGARAPVQIYALFENARRARLKLDRAAYRETMGRLFAPFTDVASANPHAMSRTQLAASAISDVTPENRIVSDPFPRRVIARDQANQGAAVIIASLAAARALGVPEDKWVFLHAGADITEQTPAARPDLGRYRAAGHALRHALEAAGVTIEDIALFDLYSCFPIAVFSVLEELGLAPDDPRPLTVTGGLPFFGGAGNNYSTHAIAAMTRALRTGPGAYGLVGANGGFLSKYSVGIYSTRPTAWRTIDSSGVQALVDSAPVAPLAVETPHGIVETYTVDHDRDPQHGVIVCRTPAGDRFIAMTTPEQPHVLASMKAAEPLGGKIACVKDDRGRRIVTEFTPVSGA